MFGKKKINIEDEENMKNTNGAEDTEDTFDNETAEGQEIAENEESTSASNDAKYNELQDKYLRLYSDFENFRRRSAKERIELIQQANKDLLLNVLPVFDDFERALGSMEKATDINAVREGIMLIFNKFRNVLHQNGLKEIESVGQPFDAEMHDALTKIPAPAADLKGKVVDEIQKGYMLHDKIVRHAKVVVGE